jgi:predicted Zn-dependent protease
MVRSLLNPAIAALTLLLAGCVTQLPPSAPRPPVEERGATSQTPERKPSPALPSETEREPAQKKTLPDEAEADLPRPADPATAALLTRSDSALQAGNTGEAIAYAERAMRLRPNDPLLWMRLAELHLAANEPVAAEQLARRAVSLSGSSMSLARRAWLLVADARQAQGDKPEAQRIRAEWQIGRG